jgi:hypothetical protein
MYKRRTDLEPGMVLGHENMGVVAEVGRAVVKLWIVSTNCRSTRPRRAINTSMPVSTDGPRSSSIRRAMRQPAPVQRAMIMTIGRR